MNELQIKAFWSKVDIKQTSKECWEWLGAKKTTGYGNVKINNKYLLAHRVSFSIVNGEIPIGYLACHICDNKSCCNPSHIMLGKHKSNMIDMLIKGRQVKRQPANLGENNSRSKLKSSDIYKIRSMYSRKDKNQYQLAELFGVSQPCIGSIVRNETWRHIS